MENKFINELNQLLREDSIMALPKLPSNSIVTWKIVEKLDKIYRTLCFFIYARYVNLFDFAQLAYDISDNSDILIAIGISNHKKRDKIQKLWDNINCNDWQLIREICCILAKYDLNRYRNIENDRVFARWANEKILFSTEKCVDTRVDVLPCDMEPFNVVPYLFNIVNDCQMQLGINLHRNMLVSTDVTGIIRFLLDNNIENRTIVFYNCLQKFAIKINSFFLDCYDNIQIVDTTDSEQLFPSETSFDIFIYIKSNKASLSEALDYVNSGGVCIMLMNDLKAVVNTFEQYQYPIIFDIGGEKFVVCNKEKGSNQVIRYTSSNWQYEEIKNSIQNHIPTKFYQELAKEDFLFAQSGNYSFYNVKRKDDQVDFVWVPISDICTVVDKGEAVENVDIANEKIVTGRTLRNSSPFITNLPLEYYLHGFKNHPIKGKELYEEFQIVRETKEFGTHNYHWNVPECYIHQFNNLIDHPETIESNNFYKRLCCRILKEPTWLYSFGKICHVKASEESPICFEKYFFEEHKEEGYTDCYGQIDTLLINPKYDEQFIIYQLQEKKTPHQYLLVAPTKEEQHTYYLEKRKEYLSQYNRVTDEMKVELNEKISQTPAYIQKIGFENFRKFIHLSPMELGDVTLLVGSNNSGKSTLVKGVLLLFENLRNLIIGSSNSDVFTLKPKFRFDTDLCHDLHVGTFGRALNQNAEKKEITFIISIANFEISLIVYNDDFGDDVTIAFLAAIQIKDNKRNCFFKFNFKAQEIEISLTIAGKQIECIKIGFPSLTNLGANPFKDLLTSLPFHLLNDNSVEESIIREIDGKLGFISELADELVGVIANCKVEYLYAHGAMQKILYNFDDKNDYMALTLHEFTGERITSLTPEHDFICKWMNKFDIGEDYDIHSLEGEAYTIQIKDKYGNTTYLADKGIGTNQLMIIFLRIATIIHHYSILGKSPFRPLIIVEEPEQNLHPAFQSLLADFFAEVSTSYGFRFIIETHSEYFIRKAQVLVAEKKYPSLEKLKEENIFKVYYFPDSEPYQMEFRTDGNFSNKFGKGFFDETNNLIYRILFS